jgi:hypothetical protein
MFLCFIITLVSFELRTALEQYCMIYGNMAASFIILYDKYFNLFVKFKPYPTTLMKTPVFKSLFMCWFPEFQPLFLKFSSFLM